MPGGAYHDLAMRFPRLSSRFGSILAVALCGLAFGAAARAMKMPLKPASRNAEVQKQIRQLEDVWHDAILSGDGSAIGGLLAESYVGIGPDGNIMSRAEEVKARVGGQDRLSKLDIEDQKVRVFGSTAVVTSRVWVEGIYSGQELKGPYRYTRVWSLNRGQWRIVSFEASKVNDPSARKP